MMQPDPLERLVLGSFLTVAGLILVIFHKAIKEARDNWNERVPWILQWSPPGGVIFTVSIILIGAFLVTAGIASLISAFVQTTR
jgi:uncharacterized membrane protein HdeD (DUF308 family)